MTRQQLVEKYESLPAEAQKRIDEFMATLSLKYQDGTRQSEDSPIEEEPFVGMWRDATHLEDSTQWVRETRKAHWGRKR